MHMIMHRIHMTQDEMVEWHLWLNGHEFEQALGVGHGQGSLACYSPRGYKESDTTERLHFTSSKRLLAEHVSQQESEPQLF